MRLANLLKVQHERTRQERWNKQETKEYMSHPTAPKFDKLTYVPPALLCWSTEREGEKASL